MQIDINGTLHEERDLSLSPLDSSVYYGLSVYETMFLKNGNIAFFEEHMSRLEISTKFFNLEYPSPTEVRNRIKELVRKNQLINGRIRLIVSGGKYTELGKKNNPNSFITFEIIHTFSDSITLCTTSIKKPEPYIYPPGVKVSANHFSLMSYLEAKRKGFQEGIMLTEKEHIAEGSYCNLFWKKGDSFFTPSLDSSILDGVTRNKIIEICQNLQIECKQDKYSLQDLESCDSLYISSSTRGLLRVSRLNDKLFYNTADNEKIKIDIEYEKLLEKSLIEWSKD